MPSLTTLAIIAGAGVLLYFGFRLVLSNAKKQGVAEQVARDQEVIADAESQIHQVQAERRETPKTKEKLSDHSF